MIPVAQIACCLLLVASLRGGVFESNGRLTTVINVIVDSPGGQSIHLPSCIPNTLFSTNHSFIRPSCARRYLYIPVTLRHLSNPLQSIGGLDAYDTQHIQFVSPPGSDMNIALGFSPSPNRVKVLSDSSWHRFQSEKPPLPHSPIGSSLPVPPPIPPQINH